MPFGPRLVALIQANIYYHENTYALNTPCVVALPFIYGVEPIVISNQKMGKYDVPSGQKSGMDRETDAHTHSVI